MKIAIIGGGPAGLRAAEVAARGGAKVQLFDAKPSVGRKFLVAGRGGLNLTKAEPLEQFTAVYSGPSQPSGIWASLVAQFDYQALQAWAAELGVETFVASTRRIYPRELKAAPLLRRWVARLRELGVEFFPNHRWTALATHPLRLQFLHGQEQRWIQPDAVILALGGGSWPQTGSDGAWTTILANLGVNIHPLSPANCGWQFAWPAPVLAEVEGQPLKSIAVRAGRHEVKGELLLTNYGLEGGAIYALGATLRAMHTPELSIDFKPTFSVPQLVAKMGPIRRNLLAEARQRWRLSPAAFSLLSHDPVAQAATTPEALACRTKDFQIQLTGPRPLAEAISSAGGIGWDELDSGLMLKRLPGVFAAGEMIDWEAPTGGYLIQGCFATGTHAAKHALLWTVKTIRCGDLDSR